MRFIVLFSNQNKILFHRLWRSPQFHIVNDITDDLTLLRLKICIRITRINSGEDYEHFIHLLIFVSFPVSWSQFAIQKQIWYLLGYTVLLLAAILSPIKCAQKSVLMEIFRLRSCYNCQPGIRRQNNCCLQVTME